MEKQDNAKNTRLEYVDLAKGIMILLVVAGHIIQEYCAMAEQEPIHAFIYSFHMPLFFLLSGYVMGITQPKLMSQSFWKWLLHKMETLLIPFVVWRLLVYRFIDPTVSSSLDIDAFVNLVDGSKDGGAWFLLALLVIEVVSYPVYRFNKLWAWLIPICYLVAVNVIGAPWVYSNPYHIICFLAGYLMFKNKDFLLRPEVATIAVLCFILSELFYPNPLLLTLPAGVALLYVCKQIQSGGGNSYLLQNKLSAIGQNTLAIYLLHTIIVFTGENKHIDISSFHRLTPVLLLTLFISFVVALICVGMAKIIAYFPMLNFLLFGKKTMLKQNN